MKKVTSWLAAVSTALVCWYLSALMAKHGMEWTDWRYPVWLLFCLAAGSAVGTWIRKRHAHND